MKTNIRKIKSIMKDMKKKQQKSVSECKTLFDFIKFAINSYNRQRKIKVALRKTKKEIEKSKTDQPQYGVVYSKVAEILQKYDWLGELPLHSISNSCKEEIIEMVRNDVENQTDEKAKIIKDHQSDLIAIGMARTTN